jgi:hypothetical protein
MKLSDLLKTLAENANVEGELPDSLDAEIPAEQYQQFVGNLVSVDNAKHKKEVRSHLFGEFANLMRENVSKQLEKAGFSPEEIQEFRRSKESVFEDVPSALAQALNKQQPASNQQEQQQDNDAKGKRLQEQIKELQEKLGQQTQAYESLQAEKEEALNNLRQQHQQQLAGERLAAEIAQRQPAGDMSKSSFMTIARALINEEMNRHNAALKLTDTGDIELIDKEAGTPVLNEKNQIIRPSDFVDETLTKHKVMQVKKSGDSNSTGHAQASQPPATRTVETRSQQENNGRNAQTDYRSQQINKVLGMIK